MFIGIFLHIVYATNLKNSPASCNTLEHRVVLTAMATNRLPTDWRGVMLEMGWTQHPHPEHPQHLRIPEQVMGTVTPAVPSTVPHGIKPSHPFLENPITATLFADTADQCHEQGLHTHRGGCGSSSVPPSPTVPKLGLRPSCSWRGVSSSDGSKIQTWRGNAGHWERCLAQLKDLLFSTGCSLFISNFLTIFVLGIFFI